MTRYEKITISLPSRAAETARRAVREGRATSVSAYVVEALDTYRRSSDLRSLLSELLAESGGPLTAGEERAARRELGMTRGNKRR